LSAVKESVILKGGMTGNQNLWVPIYPERIK